MIIVNDGSEFRMKLAVTVVVGRTARIISAGAGVFGYPGADFSAFYSVTPVGYAMRSPYGITPPDTSGGNSSVPPYRYGAGDFGYFYSGGVLVEYESDPIECTAEWFSNPITLTNTHEWDSRVTFWEATVPATVEVQF